MNSRRIISIILAVTVLLSVLGVTAYAEGDKAKVTILDTKAYEVEKDETKIYVPIYVEGSIDMQCYDITVTYDKSMLDMVEDETYISLPEGEYTYTTVNTTAEGEVRFAGMTVEEGALTTTGQIGQICFTSAKRVTKDDMTTTLKLTVNELGFGTEVADIEVVPEATVSLNKSPAPVTVTLGDVNADSKINATDALAILQHSAKIKILEGDALTAADITEDTKVDASDALRVLQIAAGIY